MPRLQDGIKTETRRCKKCKKILPLEEKFYRNKSSLGGFESRCKDCRKIAYDVRHKAFIRAWQEGAPHRRERRNAAKKFWARVLKTETCWLWQGGRLRKPLDYGQVWFYGKERRAHQVAWIITYGEIPDGQYILHRCDVPACCRPDHLYAGTAQQNSTDILRRQRTIQHKLSYAIAAQIRTLAAEGGVSPKKLAAQFNVHVSTIHAILSNKRWKA